MCLNLVKRVPATIRENRLAYSSVSRWDSSWIKRSRVALISKKDADWMIRRHYLGRWPGVVVAKLGLLVDGDYKALIVFALPPQETMRRYHGYTWELARLWADDELPRNTESWLIGKAFKWIKQHHPEVMYLVSYADPSQGHIGVIYKATNWLQDGKTDDDRKSPRCDYVNDSGKKYSRRGHVPDGVNIHRVPRISKHRFVIRLG